MTEQRPKLSVVVLAYNHETFIEQALASVLMQEVDFSYEVIVGEDCSTDGTRARVAALAAQHPDALRPVYHARNGGMGANLRACLTACRGEYIALLEGDDYWTSPHKLQRQVDWLDEHPDFALCFHPVAERYDDGTPPPAPNPAPAAPRDVYTFEDFLVPGATLASTGATVLRNVLPTWPDWLFAANPIDFSLAALYSEHGPAKRLPEVMGVYRIHRGGVWSGAARHQNSMRLLRMYEQLARHYAATPHGPVLHRHLYGLYLLVANVHANHGYTAEAVGLLRQAVRLGPGGAGPGLSRWLGVGLRLARSLGRRPQPASMLGPERAAPAPPAPGAPA